MSLSSRRGLVLLHREAGELLQPAAVVALLEHQRVDADLGTVR